ncbi:hypothetical protein ACFQ3S_18695 [Mucilaginibacter terrae]|uniref:hypothetical protein n=1 Tax=Mucilaginibacter terrae TaxID=1955052 RepID=UPI00362E8E99
MKQKKQKFKSPPYASFAAQGFYPAKLVSTMGFLYFALSKFSAGIAHQAKSKRPLPLRTGHRVLPAFARSWEATKKKPPPQTLPGREGLKF